MLIVFGTDSFAYFGGLLFGKHQMAKNISPKKTWEGFGIGQVITIILAMLILFGFSKINHDPNVAEQIMGVQFEQPLSNATHQLSTSNTFYVHP
ncbi:phosphatidate cytidylyltransferase [bacterium]|nr:phosphatidate cytidylyltransferase [bacterium]MBR2652335.1 phosphatidate cytidylyltransferase [bacterium]